MKLHVNKVQWLEPSSKPTGRLSHSLCHGADLAVFPSEYRDDAVRFTQFVGTQDHSLITVGRHGRIVSRLDDECLQIRAVVP
jgi:hypothetical protein